MSDDAVRRRIRILFTHVVVVPAIALLAIVLLSPADVLERHVTVQAANASITNVLNGLFVPRDVYRHARSTPFPQVASLATSLVVLWAFASFLAMLYIVIRLIRIEKGPLGRATSYLSALGAIGVAPALLWAFASHLASPGDWSLARGLTGTRLGFAIVDIFGALMCATAVALLPNSLLQLFWLAAKGK